MIIGDTIFWTIEEQATTLTVYSPWMPRMGNAVVASVEVIDFVGTDPKLTSVLETKNSEETDSSAGAATGSAITQVSAGVSSSRFSSLKELVRFKFTLGQADEPSPGDQVAAHFRSLNLAWETN
jgi:hypothetical protein